MGGPLARPTGPCGTPLGVETRSTARSGCHNAMVMQTPTRPERRRTRNELRKLIVDAGTRLLLEEGLGSGVEHLTFKRVYDRLEETTGVRVTNSSVIGRIWRSHADFQTDLLSSFARQSGSSAVEETLAAGAAALAECDRSTVEERWRAVIEAIRRATEAHIEAVVEAETWPPWVGVWALVGSEGDRRLESVREALTASYVDITARYEEQYAAMFAYCGFRIRAPLTLHQLTVAAGALAEGCALRERVDVAGMRRVDRPTGPGGTLQPWTLFGLAVVALIEQFTEPDPEWKVEAA
jgi:hypothetical protein